MRNLLALSTLAFSTLIATTYALPEAFPKPTPPPTAFNKRQSDEDASRVSEALASATSAIAEHPSDASYASSIVSDIEEHYGTILDQATGCDSSRWARITDAIGNFDDDFGDGLRDLFDGIFDNDDDDCDDDDNNDDDDGLIDEIFDDAGAKSAGVAFFGALGAALLASAALL